MNIPKGDNVWVDVFELSRFRGQWRRLHGPTHIVSVRSRSADWGISIDSLIVGPGCYVRMYRAGEGDGEGTWLLPGQVVQDATDVMDDAVDSLSILEGPPKPGEPGHVSYLAACRKQKPAGEPRA